MKKNYDKIGMSNKSIDRLGGPGEGSRSERKEAKAKKQFEKGSSKSYNDPDRHKAYAKSAKKEGASKAISAKKSGANRSDVKSIKTGYRSEARSHKATAKRYK